MPMFENKGDGIVYSNRMNISNVQFSPFLMSNSSLFHSFPERNEEKNKEHRKKTNRISHAKNIVAGLVYCIYCVGNVHDVCLSLDINLRMRNDKMIQFSTWNLAVISEQKFHVFSKLKPSNKQILWRNGTAGNLKAHLKWFS